MNRIRPSLEFAAAALGAWSIGILPATADQVPVPRPRPVATTAAAVPMQASLVPAKFLTASLPAETGSIPDTDQALVKQALEHVRRGKQGEATALQKSVRDPVGRKLIEWAILRSDDNTVSATRYMDFVRDNSHWATVRTFRRRAENLLWHEKPDPVRVRAFFAQVKPTSGRGKLALARALMTQGDRNGAAQYVRDAWRNEEMSAELEQQVTDTFGDMLTRADHKARMDRRLYDEDGEAAQRMARRLGPAEMAIAKARIAVSEKASNAGALLDAVPEEARNDAGYLHARIQWLRRSDKIAEAAKLMLAAPRDPAVILDTDDWWVERRLLARKLLDIGDARTAYQVARDATAPEKDNYRAEQEFTAGWIAFRFLNEPLTALPHFARVGRGAVNPISLARASYWQGRVHEALGRIYEARTHYEAASRYPTAYYGQLARAKLGVTEVGLRNPPHFEGAQLAAIRNLDIVRAVELLYAVGEREMVAPMVADLADRAVDIGALVVIAEICQKQNDARAKLLVGKALLGRGFAFDHYAFPVIGVPQVSQVGPEVERSIIYAIVRQESMFNQRTVSTANALGLMQVTPPAGRHVAKKFGVAFDRKRLLSDPAYNTQMGAAEIGDLLKVYRGSHILAFAGYNAGMGRVKDWIERFGDPRDPKVDPVDWVERIPFAETRNYVQRVIENAQVYRARFRGPEAQLTIEADLRGAAAKGL